MKNIKKMITSIFISGLCVLSFSGMAFADEDNEATSTNDKGTPVICSGVYISGIDVGGKTEEEAKTLVDKYVDSIKSKKIIVKANDKSIDTTVEDIGYSAKENDYITQALNIGTCGNVIKRYKDKKDVENGKLEYNLEFSYDDNKIDTFIDDNIDKCNIKAKEPSMTPKSSNIGSGNIADQFDYKEGVTGKEVDVDDLKSKVKEALKEWSTEDVTVEAVVKTTEPKYTIEQLRGIDSKLGEYTTSFGSSSEDRSKNVKNAASKINGTILYPGETFSTLKKITPLTTDNGYALAGSYVSGKVVDSVGGGVCQVSTTLYNAVIRAELDVKVRNNHSMVVTYVDIAYDAMIAESSGSDFKFCNNTDAPVYIEGGVNGKTITFRIYGKETRPSNRTIKFEKKILQTVQPGADVITTDNTKDPSYYKVTQSAHVGYKAELYKIVCIDGAEKERIKLNTSTYKAAPKYITVGSKTPEKKEEPTATEIPNTGAPTADKPVATQAAKTPQPLETKPVETKPVATKQP